MSLNLSLYDGVPSTLEAAEQQFFKHISNPRQFGIFRSQGGFLVLKKIEKGKYKKLWGTFWYSKYPKCKVLKTWDIKRNYPQKEKQKEPQQNKKFIYLELDYKEGNNNKLIIDVQAMRIKLENKIKELSQ